MGALTDQSILVTGVLTEASIAFRVAEIAQREDATVILTGVGRSRSLTERIAKRLPKPAAVVPLDVTNDEELADLERAVREHTDRLDGVLHAIGFAPTSTLGGGFFEAPWSDVSTALQISTYSLVSLARATVPLMDGGGAIVGLDFDATRAWPAYDWMGVAKAGLESTARYLAKELGPRGVRVNLVAAGPLRTMAAKSIPGFEEFEQVWKERAPLGWDVDDSTAAAKACVALLSDWFPATTGSVVHVDGGVHAVGA